MRGVGDESLSSSDGLIILTADIRRPGVCERFWQHGDDLPGERVRPTIYELDIADWDKGLWDEELQWMSDLMEESSGLIVIWKI